MQPKDGTDDIEVLKDGGETRKVMLMVMVVMMVMMMRW